MNHAPLAPALGQGIPRQRRRVNAWPRIQQALKDATKPLTHGELKVLTGLDHTNISVALASHPAQLIRTGKRKHYQYRLRTDKDPGYELGA